MDNLSDSSIIGHRIYLDQMVVLRVVEQACGVLEPVINQDERTVCRKHQELPYFSEIYL